MVSLPVIALGIAQLGQGNKSASGCPQPAALKCAANATAHLKSYKNESGATEAIKSGNRETQRKYLKGIEKLSSKKSPRQDAQLNCLYTSACIQGNKQNELEYTVQHELPGCIHMYTVQKPVSVHLVFSFVASLYTILISETTFSCSTALYLEGDDKGMLYSQVCSVCLGADIILTQLHVNQTDFKTFYVTAALNHTSLCIHC